MGNGIKAAGSHTGACNTALAGIRYKVSSRHASLTGDLAYSENGGGWPFSCQRQCRVFGKWRCVIFLGFITESQSSHKAESYNGSIPINAAAIGRTVFGPNNIGNTLYTFAKGFTPFFQKGLSNVAEYIPSDGIHAIGFSYCHKITHRKEVIGNGLLVRSDMNGI